MAQDSIQNKQVIRNPLIIALDVDSAQVALDLATDLRPYAGGYKLGPRLIHRYGQEFVQRVAEIAPVFVDCKFFDIPSTMVASVQSAFDSGASLVTVHALSGLQALTKLAELEAQLQQVRPFQILCVTILTSWEQKSLPAVFKNESISLHVQSLASLVRQAGLAGLVCSAAELEDLKQHPHFFVVPGIRIGESEDDQVRKMSPEQAMKLGASALVVGRPIIEAKQPIEVAKEFLKRMVN